MLVDYSAAGHAKLVFVASLHAEVWSEPAADDDVGLLLVEETSSRRDGGADLGLRREEDIGIAGNGALRLDGVAERF
jgi:hypothetical protein